MQQERPEQHRSSAITLRTLLMLFTGGLVLLLITISMAVSFDRFRSYMAEELEGRTRDAATAIGLSVSNAIDASDVVAVGRLIDSVFDSGDYLSVAFVDHENRQIVGRSRSLDDLGVPGWFMELADLPRPVGTADVLQGWRWLGQIRVRGHPGNAYRDLWRVSLSLALAAVVVGSLALVLLYVLLGRLLLPLRTLERQAKAIGRRDFRLRTKVRSTRELNHVTQAMNQMTEDLEQLFAGQAALISHLRRINNEDSLTGLASRNAFEQRLAVETVSEEERKPGALVLVQITGFADFNKRLGRPEADQLLIRAATEIREFLHEHAGSFAGRRAGAEFAVFIPGGAPADALLWARDLVEKLQTVCIEFIGEADPDGLALTVHAGVAGTSERVSVKSLFESADVALRRAQTSGISGCELADTDLEVHHGAEQWRVLLERALEREQLWLWQQPLVAASDELPVFQQVFSRVLVDGEWIRGNVFVPIAERYGIMARIDLMVISRVLERLETEPRAVLGLSLGASSVADAEFSATLVEKLEAAGPLVERLWVGVPEQVVHYRRRNAQVFIRRLRRCGAMVMVDRFGVGGVPFSYMKNLPIQALRIDSSFVHGIDRHDENRFYLESMITIARGRGVRVFASGVETEAEWRTLKAAGVDGAIGYHLGRPAPPGAG
ncbi:diguanylate cyclase/phosphodiesterase [Marinobacter daqiaonensis]|uniref:Diguanylate cyclase/phosphodiesterase n=1 Tax=Marinobacter daqiaonensis TaxID=650891 RepID=A0A1I6I199_9GAMM|nr:EAL domain-containing protein [Marinobacter daqiaonensis]SFR60491.1 diguanylate cyclase/phosphodiesterase [Marinobacter daqiaonensis]